MTERVYYFPGLEIVEREYPNGRKAIPVLKQWFAMASLRRTIILLPEGTVRHLINWLLSALAVWVVAQFIHGFHVRGVSAALIAALVIGLVNATLGAFLKLITLPLTVLTLGIFWLVINALMLKLASAILAPSFQVDSFAAAFWGAIVLSLVNMLFRWMAGTNRKDA